MQGQMINSQLTITEIMRHAERVNGDTEVVSITHDNPNHRYTLKDAFKRVRQLANALQDLGVKQGDRVATLAWNDYRHLELYYAVSCSGAVLHTVNPRLFPEQIEYIINHAEDTIVFFDPIFMPLIEQLKEKLPTVTRFIALTDSQHLPTNGVDALLDYETLIQDKSSQFTWPDIKENQASSLCYTSGTTGNPKGVLYSHRSTVLHSMGSALPDAFALSLDETVMPIVPMFHVNGWGLAYSAPMTGTKLVLPGPKMADGATLTRLINEEGVTMTAGVPVIWLTLLEHLKNTDTQVPSLNRIVVGGSACPELLITEFDELFNVSVHHAWGMTEMSPLGTFNQLTPSIKAQGKAQQMATKLKQGRVVFGVDIRIEDWEGNELEWTGHQFGSVKVRGPWVASGYYKQGEQLDSNGYFDTGDVASIDKNGYMMITDRSKDVIKSGGEWISSIELENIAVGHPDVKEAAVIGVSHPKWGERPLLIVVTHQVEIKEQELLDYFDGKVAKFCIPDAVVFINSLPHTATGKLSKKDLRAQFAHYALS
ncbi:long-chain-fatty-acid--CoA ligase [Vibrio methylphosphonaticus]|uniref:long-chain-fatty-acid--CoA ligase n=1 Tax=Vibrio methylphosphonaticus TaxID=2946866 RepID=UPI00202A3F40|nr:long-chain-fatty-acid--CoA ligase [Vibrio methylphosphonaticus]MCL9774547.1 long-chain-fatty-acid--CoA ligase [Vibrio methylphosphonaticus]